MSDTIQTTLQEHFGFTRMRPGQQEVIEQLLDGHSAAAIFPTGGGKSLCYQLPDHCTRRPLWGTTATTLRTLQLVRTRQE